MGGTMLTHDFRNPTLPRALVLGALGGIALVLVSIYSNRGPLIFLPYTALLAALAALVGLREPSFRTRFVAVLAGFMVASLILYVYVGVFGSSANTVSVSGHTWRLAFLLAVGALLAAAISYVTGWPTRTASASTHDQSTVAA
jgi:hypothetical protein